MSTTTAPPQGKPAVSDRAKAETRLGQKSGRPGDHPDAAGDRLPDAPGALPLHLRLRAHGARRPQVHRVEQLPHRAERSAVLEDDRGHHPLHGGDRRGGASSSASSSRW
ncbi:hypothetical protein [Nocardioides convexus]|uniref:hypothetical protein n=1 Tax=Nocardioides convexus TaxID=2712224 RepID=UPI002418303B|nr:hypothetical protein [Nocardioides convexus]